MMTDLLFARRASMIMEPRVIPNLLLAHRVYMIIKTRKDDGSSLCP
ncbi:MAG TPA: hypothetical protein VK155_17365 [Bacteroidales bacterium]|nr:hypothetical protein [Bacteroidales bacterium]